MPEFIKKSKGGNMAEILVLVEQVSLFRPILETLEEIVTKVRVMHSAKNVLDYLKKKGTKERMVCVDLTIELGDGSLVHDGEDCFVDNNRCQGVVLLRRIKEQYSDLPVILLTTWEESSSPRQLARQEKFDGIVTCLTDQGNFSSEFAEVKTLWDKLVLDKNPQLRKGRKGVVIKKH